MIAVYHQVSNFSVIKWIEHLTFIRDDDDVCPIIFQHTDLNFRKDIFLLDGRLGLKKPV